MRFLTTHRMRSSVRTMRWAGMLALLLPLSPASALNPTYWTNSDTGLWNDPNNWTVEGVPDSGTNAYIDNGGTAVITSGIDAEVGYLILHYQLHYQHVGGYYSEVIGKLLVAGGSLTADEFEIRGGGNYSGSFSQTGGSVSVTRPVRLIEAAATLSGGTWTSGSISLEGGSFTIEGTAEVTSPLVQLQGSSLNRLHLYGGTLTTGNVELTSGSYSSYSTVDFNGGTLKLSQDQEALFLGFKTVDFAGNANIIDTQGFAVISNVPWYGGSGTVTVTKAGSGTLTLKNRIFVKEIVVSEGRLHMDNTAYSDLPDVHVLSGASLSGSGNIAAITLEDDALLAPGTSIGTLTGKSLLWEAGAILEFDLGAGSSDFLSLSGALSKGGSGTYAFQFLDADWQVGATYDLIGFSGTDFLASDFSFSNGEGFTGYFTLDGSRLQFTVTAVPEPSTYAMAIAGLLVVIVVARKWRSAQAHS